MISVILLFSISQGTLPCQPIFVGFIQATEFPWHSAYGVCVRQQQMCTIPYYTRCSFNVRSKADSSQLNLAHGACCCWTQAASGAAGRATLPCIWYCLSVAQCLCESEVGKVSCCYQRVWRCCVCVCEPAAASTHDDADDTRNERPHRPTDDTTTTLINVAETIPPSSGDEREHHEHEDGSYCRLEISIQ